MSITDLHAERVERGLPPEGPNGRSIAERAGDDPFTEPDPYADTAEQDELFVIEQGRKVPFSKLVDRGIPVEYRVNLRSRSLVGGPDMGLLSFKDPDVLLIVPTRQGDVVASPTYSEDGVVEKVTIRANFKPLSFHPDESPQGRALLGLEEA